MNKEEIERIKSEIGIRLSKNEEWMIEKAITKTEEHCKYIKNREVNKIKKFWIEQFATKLKEWIEDFAQDIDNDGISKYDIIHCIEERLDKLQKEVTE